MKCRVCGAETNSSRTLCSKCHEEIELLSSRYTEERGKINLDFSDHHFFSR
ncbi:MULTISPECIES: hypothetical protein [unclassified Halanaerobium]|uniref:hypothetical protein n=1 Tax=unclassified Halanaerobium TaxID=2641197 RepID=UPI000E1837C7|nr:MULTISPECIES: hypothetical protein [unclassified Halanaerobium]RCW50542.1 hypothetical protein DFR78_103127 [Halanaerobium sp. MA284_MarDTE_T2]RCW86025.1 hypothetical protein DER71_10990 [Halanaerobium sp. DL-01]